MLSVVSSGTAFNSTVSIAKKSLKTSNQGKQKVKGYSVGYFIMFVYWGDI